jgi:hypothetical protein
LWRAVAFAVVVAIVGSGLTLSNYHTVNAQQDAEDAVAGATGADGTVNGVPRESSDTAPAVITGPGVPLPPPQVILPPSVPGMTGAAAGEPGVVNPAADAAAAPAADIAAAPAAQPTELVFNAVSDTTVFLSEPNAPQTAESAGLLAIGGPQGAVSLISFDVTGLGGAAVTSALLSFTGAASSAGGSVNVIYDYVASDGLTANDVPGSASALSFHGAPAWFERIESGGVTSVDVSGSILGDGAITFVLPGQAHEQGLLYAIESGVAPQLVLNVVPPA